MNWTETQLAKVYADRGEPLSQSKPRKPAVRVQLGNWVKEEIVLTGPIPSKKNEKRAIIKKGDNGEMIPGLVTEKKAKALLQILTDQCTHLWRKRHKWPLTNVTIGFRFQVSHCRQDLDNMLTATLDSLVSGGVLRNDSMKHLLRLKEIDFEMVDPGKEGVKVFIEGQEYIEQVVGAA